MDLFSLENNVSTEKWIEQLIQGKNGRKKIIRFRTQINGACVCLGINSLY